MGVAHDRGNSVMSRVDNRGMGVALLRCLLCSSRCCPCRELRPCPCCLPRRPRCRPCGLQLRPGLPLCLPLHPRRCPCRHPRCRRSLRWYRTLRRQLRWNRPCCQEGGYGRPLLLRTCWMCLILMQPCCRHSVHRLGQDGFETRQILKLLHLASSLKFLPHCFGFRFYICICIKL